MKLFGLKTEQKGFTLIEMLVVLAIISVLSIASVNGYTSYRRSALLDFAADNLISEFNQMRSRTIYQNLCYGMRFKQDGDFYSVTNFSQKFDGEKVWDVEQNSWLYKGCKDFGADAKILPFESDPEIKIVSVESEKGVDGDGLVVNFIPPNGKLEVSEDFDSLLIKLQYGEVKDEGLQKTVKIDLKNALAEVL
ncbi:MAG: prepilin-type N-terminal cleavage/methylation domain-containing protein [Patescibacteria group bacterium]